MKDMKSRRERMAQFRHGVDWMDVVVVGCIVGSVILGIALFAYHFSRIA